MRDTEYVRSLFYSLLSRTNQRWLETRRQIWTHQIYFMKRLEEEKFNQYMNKVLCSNTAPCRRTKFWKLLQPSTSKTALFNTQKPCLVLSYSHCFKIPNVKPVDSDCQKKKFKNIQSISFEPYSIAYLCYKELCEPLQASPH